MSVDGRDGPTIGLVGCGRWGRHVLRDLVTLGCEVHVVARSESSTSNARAGAAAGVVASIDRLPSVEGVVVVTPTATHAAVVEESLALGAPVFCEKPLTDSAASAHRLARDAPDRLFVMDKWRYHPAIEMLRDIARSGELGDVQGLRVTRVGWGHSYSDVDTIWIHAPHDLSIALEVLDEVPPARFALAESVGGEATGLLGALGSEPWVVTEVSCSSYERRREVRLVCAEGTAWLSDGYADHLGVARHDALGAEPERRSLPTEMPLLLELKAFVEHLRGGPAPRSSAAEGAEIVSRIEELRELAGLRGPDRPEPAGEALGRRPAGARL